MSGQKMLSRLLREHGPAQVAFWCPGCDGPHAIIVEGPHAWGYNGNPEAPTFTPSVLATGGASAGRCHSYVSEGHIQFLADSTHALAGQTVALAPWPEAFQ